jgi:hypothetical protein
VAVLPGAEPLGATVALAGGGVASWHPLHASSETEKTTSADHRIISGTWTPR